MAETLPESTFDRLADETLTQLVEALADAEEAFDADLESGVLTIEFEDGTKYVVNSHRAARQIWMAAGATAWHFDWDGEKWVSQKSGDELWRCVEAHTSKKLGKPLKLRD